MKGIDLAITRFGREMIARKQFDKGLGFFAAARLLESYCTNEPLRYVRLHLICQSLELILKSALLAKDFHKYSSQLPNRKQFGHDLIKIAEEVEKEFGIQRMGADLRAELGELARLYSEHHLRYSGLNDIFIDPISINVGHVVPRIAAIAKLMNREFNRTNFAR